MSRLLPWKKWMYLFKDCLFRDQPSISYLEDEISLGTQSEDHADVPVRLFDLWGLGIDQDRFLTEMVPAFQKLGKDSYDVKQRQIQFLANVFPDERVRLEAFLVGYFAGDRGDTDLQPWVEALDPEQRSGFDGIRPCRERAISYFVLERGNSDRWRIHRLPEKGFRQVVSDYRRFERVFQPSSFALTDHPLFTSFLQRMADMVRGVHSEVTSLAFTVHQMKVISQADLSGDNSPEGIHQDGADYVLSALVVERRYVQGGSSLVYQEGVSQPLIERTLEPGQGLFHADKGSPLWHDVTPVQLDPGGADVTLGWRSILGIDVDIL